MRITKGDKTVRDYLFESGVKGRFFSYGWFGKNGPAVYNVERIGVTPGRGLEATLDIERVDDKKKGKKESLNLAIHKEDFEVSIK